MMRVPSFALLCCCCCTHAELNGKAFRDPPINHKPVFYDDSLTTDAPHLIPDKNDPLGIILKNNLAVDAHEYDNGNENIDTIGSNSLYQYQTTNYIPTSTEGVHDPDHDHHNDWTSAQQWGYATLANSVVVSFSLCGIVIVKCTSGKSRRTIGDMFLGLCVSIMLGDGIMHIMPHFLGKIFP